MLLFNFESNTSFFIAGERPHFYTGFDKKDDWSLSKRPPVDDVIKIEANFMLFRDYTLINIMMVQTLVNIYRDDKDLPDAKKLKEQYIGQVPYKRTNSCSFCGPNRKIKVPAKFLKCSKK